MIIHPKITDGQVIVEDNNGQRILRNLKTNQLESMVRYQYKQMHSPGWGYNDHLDVGFGNSPDGVDYPYLNFFNFMSGLMVVHYDKNRDYTMLYSTVGVNYPKVRVQVDAHAPVFNPGDGLEQEDFTYKIGLFTRQVITPARTTR